MTLISTPQPLQKMSNINFDKHSLIHAALSALAIVCLVFWLSNSVLTGESSGRSVYEDAEIRFSNIAGERVANYAIKKKDNSFLIASQIPKELDLKIEFSHAGSFSAAIQAEYPHWLCNEHELDRAFVDIQGGSANERVKLVRLKTTEVSFSIAEAQKLKFLVRNPVNNDCGRAIVTFYEADNAFQFKLGFCVFWALVFMFCFYSGLSPYITVVGVLSNVLLIGSDASLGMLSISDLIVNTGLSVIVLSAFMVLSLLPRSRIITLLKLVILLAVCLFPIAFIAYSHVFQTPISSEAIHGAMQSYDSQIIEFWQQYVGKKRTLYLLAVLAILYALVRHINVSRARFKFTLCVSVLFLIAGLAVVAGRIHQSATTNLLMSSMIEYKWEIDAFRKISDKRKHVAIQGERASVHANDTTVIVVGESVNRKFMSAYGYVQDTTPNLDKRITAGDSILYTNAYSNHSHSNPTMSMILTQANQYNRRQWLESPSVFNFAEAASVETHWLTNHRLLGGWSNHITTIIREADRLKTINYKIGYGTLSSNYDGQLVSLYKDAIAAKPNQLTFMHLYNSHLNYCNRYPPESKKFPTELSPAIYGHIGSVRKTSEGLLGCYVNTIHYTDTVLERLIAELERKGNPSVLLYVADHAEEPIDHRTHNSAQFTYDMVNIPLFVWANQEWRDAHPEKWKNLQANKDKVFTNDLMFESILGIAGIRSPEIDTANDISSVDYQSVAKPMTLHGRVALDSDENWNYWQRQNGLLANQKGVEMVAANVESLGQAYTAATFGIKRLHINAGFSEDGEVQVVSESSATPIIAFSDFLHALSERKLNSLSISLDFRERELYELAHKEIELLRAKYSISIDLLSQRPKEFMPLFSPSFSLQMDRVNKYEQLWVTFKSRYTHLAPEPE